MIEFWSVINLWGGTPLSRLSPIGPTVQLLVVVGGYGCR